MAAFDFISLSSIEQKTGIKKPVLIFGAVGLGLVVFLINLNKGNSTPQGRVMEEGYTPTNDLETQMQMQNFNDILMGQVDQFLNQELSGFDQQQKEANAELLKEQQSNNAALLEKLRAEMDALNSKPAEPASSPVYYAPEPTPAVDPLAATREAARLQQQDKQAQSYIQMILDAKALVESKGPNAAQRTQAKQNANLARTRLSELGYDISDVEATDGLNTAKYATPVRV